MIFIINAFFELFATFNKLLPLLNSCLEFKLNFYRFVRDMFTVFSNALHAEKFFSSVLAVFNIAEVNRNVTSVALALDFVLLSPFVKG